MATKAERSAALKKTHARKVAHADGDHVVPIPEVCSLCKKGLEDGSLVAVAAPVAIPDIPNKMLTSPTTDLDLSEGPSETVADGDVDLILVHVLKDGFTALGRVWYAKQEIRVRRNSTDFMNTLDPEGRSFLDFTEDEQKSRWRGKVMFRQGPASLTFKEPDSDDVFQEKLLNAKDIDEENYVRKQHRRALAVAGAHSGIHGEGGAGMPVVHGAPLSGSE